MVVRKDPFCFCTIFFACWNTVHTVSHCFLVSTIHSHVYSRFFFSFFFGYRPNPSWSDGSGQFILFPPSSPIDTRGYLLRCQYHFIDVIMCKSGGRALVLSNILMGFFFVFIFSFLFFYYWDVFLVVSEWNAFYRGIICCMQKNLNFKWCNVHNLFFITFQLLDEGLLANLRNTE